jgi:chromosome partitioning protein
MRRIALINQKGGVGKTTTTANLGAALAREGRRVVLVDLDPQANLSLHLDAQLASDQPSTYTVLLGNGSFAEALRPTSTPLLRLVASNIDLSGAELELASALGRETLLRDAVDGWERDERETAGRAPADYVLFDCPPSLGLLSVNGLVAAREAIVTVQTEFFALQGMSKLVEVMALLRRRLNPTLALAGILPCLYDSRLKLAREVLAEIRAYFPGQVFQRPIGKNVKLAEAPSYGKTIFEYAPESGGALDYRTVALELIAQEGRDPELAAQSRTAAIPPAHTPASAPSNREAPLRDVVVIPADPPADARRTAVDTAPRNARTPEDRLPASEPLRDVDGDDRARGPTAFSNGLSERAGSTASDPSHASGSESSRSGLEPELSDFSVGVAVLEPAAAPGAPDLEQLPELPDDAVEIPDAEW